MQVHLKDVLKYIITKPGEPCVMRLSMVQQQELFAICWDTDVSDGLSTSATVKVKVGSGWTTFFAMELKQILHTVDITAVAFKTVHT